MGARMYFSESSQRDRQVSQEEFDRRWDLAFGKKELVEWGDHVIKVKDPTLPNGLKFHLEAPTEKVDITKDDDRLEAEYLEE